MKRIIVLALTLTVAGVGAAETVPAKDKDKTAKPAVTVIKREDTNSVTGLLSRLWGKLRAASPQLLTKEDRASTQVAGVRGAEATDTALQPYWKDDKEADPNYVKQVNAFKTAQQLADTGAYADAAVAFDRFITDYPDSQLKANAEFGQALAYMSAGNNDKGKQALERFVSQYPQHPLVNDARSLLLP